MGLGLLYYIVYLHRIRLDFDFVVDGDDDDDDDDDDDIIIINSEYARHIASLIGKRTSSLCSLIIHLMIESFLKYHL